MARENPTWGAPRIQSELALLGHTMAESTVAKYVPRGKEKGERKGDGKEKGMSPIIRSFPSEACRAVVASIVTQAASPPAFPRIRRRTVGPVAPRAAELLPRRRFELAGPASPNSPGNRPAMPTALASRPPPATPESAASSGCTRAIPPPAAPAWLAADCVRHSGTPLENARPAGSETTCTNPDTGARARPSGDANANGGRA